MAFHESSENHPITMDVPQADDRLSFCDIRPLVKLHFCNEWNEQTSGTKNG
jgi:hypothetical protein